MKIIWSSLVKFPPLCNADGIICPNHCGWMFSAAKAIQQFYPEIELIVLVYSNCKHLTKRDINGIRYYEIPEPSKSYTKTLSKLYSSTVEHCSQILRFEKPDVIHAHGTEYALSCSLLLAAEACGLRTRTAVSIQGLASIYERYIYGGIPSYLLWLNLSLLDLITFRWPPMNRSSMLNRGKLETRCIKTAQHIIGRTEWDYAHTATINKDATYHTCHEILRDTFYTGKWTLDACEKNTIFVSNCSAALKGAHQVINALRIVKDYIPEVKLRMVGGSPYSKKWHERLRFNSYQKYLLNLICHNNLLESVTFLGSLTEQEMKDEFLRCQLYILPSAIENSPNSLCEATMLGVPSLVAYRGGSTSLVREEQNIQFYCYEDVEVLAIKIIQMLSRNVRLHYGDTKTRTEALIRHNPKAVATSLHHIYETISKRSK